MKAELFKTTYEDLKASILLNIETLVKTFPSHIVDLSEAGKEIVTASFGQDEDPQVAMDLALTGGNLVLTAGVFEEDTDYYIIEFEVPKLLEILCGIVQPAPCSYSHPCIQVIQGMH